MIAFVDCCNGYIGILSLSVSEEEEEDRCGVGAGGHFDIKLTLTPPILLYPYSISIIIIIIIIMSILFLAAHIDYSEKIKKTLESWNQTKNKIFQFIAFFGLSLSFCLFTLFSVFFFPSIRLFSPHPMWQQLGLLDFSMYSFFFLILPLCHY